MGLGALILCGGEAAGPGPARLLWAPLQFGLATGRPGVRVFMCQALHAGVCCSEVLRRLAVP